MARCPRCQMAFVVLIRSVLLQTPARALGDLHRERELCGLDEPQQATVAFVADDAGYLLAPHGYSAGHGACFRISPHRTPRCARGTNSGTCGGKALDQQATTPSRSGRTSRSLRRCGGDAASEVRDQILALAGQVHVQQPLDDLGLVHPEVQRQDLDDLAVRGSGLGRFVLADPDLDQVG
jgi:hypothetical protein